MNAKIDIASRIRLERVITDNLDRLVSFACRRTGKADDAEDIVHSAIVRLLEQDISTIASPEAYLFMTVRNLCYDQARSVKDVTSVDNLEIAVPDNDDVEEATKLLETLNILNDKEREVVIMHTLDNLTFVEIADILASPVSTVKSRFSAGIKHLKNLLTDKTNKL